MTWNIVKPLAATNYVTNPSFERYDGAYMPTGWTKTGTPTVIVEPGHSWRGPYNCKIVTTNVNFGIIKDISGTNGQSYTWSLWVYVLSGSAVLTAYDYNTFNNVVSTASVGTGWQRMTVTKVAASGGVRIAILSSTASSTIYCDAAQVEDGTIATTYIDGDEPGCYWTGVPHASTSVRDGQSREGGQIVPLTNYFTKVQKALGAGTPPFKNVSLPFGLIGGSVYQRTIAQERNFSIRGWVSSQLASVYHSKRRELFDLLKHDAVTPSQPVKLRYDDGGLAQEIKAVYNGGLEGTDYDGWWEQIDLAFTANDPKFYSEKESSQVLGYQTTVANANYILERDTTGLWKALSTGVNGTIYDIKQGPDGNIYICGTFTNCGDANGDYIVGWNGTAFFSLGTGLSGGVAEAMAFDAAGNLYVGGDFTSAGGVANTSKLAMWNGTTWVAVGSGFASGTVSALAFDGLGNLYIGGGFVNQHDANGDYIVGWNGSAYFSLGTGMDGAVNALVTAPNGTIYIGGYFTSGGGVSSPHIIKYNYSTGFAAVALGVNDAVQTLAISSSGIVYLGGNFTYDGGYGSVLKYIAQYNGTTLSPVGPGLGGGAGVVYKLYFNNLDQNLYIGGLFTQPYGASWSFPDSFCYWNGNAYLPMDAILPSAPNTIYAIFVDATGNFYVGYNHSGSAVSANVTTTSNASTKTYPRTIFTGPGKCYQSINYTTGRRIYFNDRSGTGGLNFQAGETAVLDFTQGNITFTSSWRKDILSYIQDGSNLDFYLQPGANNISCYYASGTTTASGITMLWRDASWMYDAVEP